MSPNAAHSLVVCGRDAPGTVAALARVASAEFVLESFEGPQELPDPGRVSRVDAVVWGADDDRGCRVPSTLLGYPWPVVVTTPDASEDATLAFLRAGAAEVVTRSLATSGYALELVAGIRRALGRAEARRQVSGQGGSLHDAPAALLRALEQAKLLIVLTDADATIEYVNPYWSEQTGYPPEVAFGRTPAILKSGKMSVRDYQTLWGRISTGKNWHGHLVNRRADGSEYAEHMIIAPVMENGTIRHHLAIGVDATDSVGMHEALHRAKRFETLGWAVGGMAHEFNNIFAVVRANAELIARDLGGAESSGSTASAVEDLLNEVDRGGSVVRRLLMYAGRWSGRVGPADLEEEVSRVAGDVRQRLPPSFTVDLRVAEGALPPISIDREGLAEVLGELISNACDRMPEGGTVRLSVGVIRLEEEFVVAHPWARSGRFVHVSVSDSGVVVEQADQERFFDPFASSRLMGGVSALGPPMAYTFVKQHGGLVLGESTAEGGTTIDLLFPPGEGRSAEEKSPAPAPTAESNRLCGVLYVDDNAPLRRAACRLLKSAGFLTFEAGDGHEALRVLEVHRQEIDVILSDVVMPELGGAELYTVVRQLDDPPAFVFTTGHAETHGDADTLIPPGVPYVLKPWSAVDLIDAVRDAASKRSADASLDLR